MLVRDIMTPRLELVNRRSSAVAAARKMLALDIGVLPVVDRGHLIGMVTDRDLALRCVAQGLDPQRTTVDQIMTPQVITCREDEDVRVMVAMMEAHSLRRIVVANNRGKPVGIVSLSDAAARGAGSDLVSDALASWAHTDRSDFLVQMPEGGYA